MPVVTIVLSVAAMLTYGYSAFAAGPGVSPPVEAAEPEPTVPSSTMTSSSTTTSSTSTTTTSTTTTTTTLPSPPPDPPHEARYVVPTNEVAPDAKQLAADIAFWLTTYEVSDSLVERLGALDPVTGVELLVQASRPLTHSGSWSRGQVVYPQMGGLTEDRAAVMVVVRQTVGSGSEADFSVVRTLDIRLVLGESGAWRFDFLSDAGGAFDSVEDLALAHAVARNPRIEMPDSARLDILAGRVSPILLQLMSEIAERTPYGVVALATGHPHNVFETDYMSHHTVGRAVDIYRIGDRLVIDDRGEGSATWNLVEWLHSHPRVLQVGSPWDIDEEPSSRRSFTDLVHQDHIHIATDVVDDD